LNPAAVDPSVVLLRSLRTAIAGDVSGTFRDASAFTAIGASLSCGFISSMQSSISFGIVAPVDTFDVFDFRGEGGNMWCHDAFRE
jgi:hypothetical protein